MNIKKQNPFVIAALLLVAGVIGYEIISVPLSMKEAGRPARETA